MIGHARLGPCLPRPCARTCWSVYTGVAYCTDTNSITPPSTSSRIMGPSSVQYIAKRCGTHIQRSEIHLTNLLMDHALCVPIHHPPCQSRQTPSPPAFLHNLRCQDSHGSYHCSPGSDRGIEDRMRLRCGSRFNRHRRTHVASAAALRLAASTWLIYAGLLGCG
jgi:hypothetical protein